MKFDLLKCRCKCESCSKPNSNSFLIKNTHNSHGYCKNCDKWIVEGDIRFCKYCQDVQIAWLNSLTGFSEVFNDLDKIMKKRDNE